MDEGGYCRLVPDDKGSIAEQDGSGVYDTVKKQPSKEVPRFQGKSGMPYEDGETAVKSMKKEDDKGRMTRGRGRGKGGDDRRERSLHKSFQREGLRGGRVTG